jgi:hypothetical protein
VSDILLPIAFRRDAARCAWALLLVVLFLHGCGYASKPVFPTDVRTVAVPIFENKSFYRGVEFDLTEALIKQIELQTPYKVTGRERADTILQGTIVAVDQAVLSRTSTGGLPQEMEMRIVVDFEWKNGRTGQLLRQRKGFAAVGRYVPTRMGDRVGETYSTAQHRAVQQLADQVVMAMRSDW